MTKKYPITDFFGTRKEWKKQVKDEEVDGPDDYEQMIGEFVIQSMLYCDVHNVFWCDDFYTNCPLCVVHEAITENRVPSCKQEAELNTISSIKKMDEQEI